MRLLALVLVCASTSPAWAGTTQSRAAEPAIPCTHDWSQSQLARLTPASVPGWAELAREGMLALSSLDHTPFWSFLTEKGRCRDAAAVPWSEVATQLRSDVAAIEQLRRDSRDLELSREFVVWLDRVPAILNQAILWTDDERRHVGRERDNRDALARTATPPKPAAPTSTRAPARGSSTGGRGTAPKTTASPAPPVIDIATQERQELDYRATLSPAARAAREREWLEAGLRTETSRVEECLGKVRRGLGAQQLRAEQSGCLLKSGAARQAGYTADLEMSDYFYQLQLRQTGPLAATDTATRPAGASETPAATKHYDRGLIGGTGWIFGFEAGTDAVDRGRAQLHLLDQMKAAGYSEAQKAEFMRTDEYQFLLGLGSSHNFVSDLVQRVALGDQFSEGRVSLSQSQLAGNLSGRSFGVLDCHSNGAMVCLAAVGSGAATAETVRLFGPQITPEALRQWEGLLQAGKIKGLDIYMNRGDPVAPASYAFGKSMEPSPLVLLSPGAALGQAVAPFFSSDALQGEIARYTPGARVTMFDYCPERRIRGVDVGYDLSFSCHSMARYQKLLDGWRGPGR